MVRTAVTAVKEYGGFKWEKPCIHIVLLDLDIQEVILGTIFHFISGSSVISHATNAFPGVKKVVVRCLWQDLSVPYILSIYLK